MKIRADEIQCKACGMVHYNTESVCENCENPLREDIPTPKENLKEKYAVYDCDGNLKGYYVTDEELDDFAVESSSDAVCKHTELTRQLFCEKIGAQDLNYIDSGEYEITFKETRKEQVERETREFLIKVLVETYNIKPEKAPDYISEFFWHKNCLYTSIDRLRNPTLTATLKKGVLF